MKYLKRCIKIKNCPSFIDFKPPSGLPDFAKFNLIYGWNASGKTSFTRVLRSFELEENYYENTRRPMFEFKLSDENVISQNDLTTLKNIRVFNKDFIEDNIYGIGGIKPIFFLGRESKEDKEKIIETENELKSLIPMRDLTKTALEKAKRNRDSMLSEKARAIKNALTTSKQDNYRNYERPDIEKAINNNIKKLEKPDSLLLSDKRLSVLKKSIQQASKKVIDELVVPDLDIAIIQDEAVDILSKSVISQIIESLQSDEIVSKWVERGLEIYKEKSLDRCAFCEQQIPQKRLSALENHFNDEYRKMIESIHELLERCNSKRFMFEFPESSNFYEDLATKYLEAKRKAENSLSSFNQAIDLIIDTLKQKEQNPFSKLKLNKSKILETKSFEKINEIINAHNLITENFYDQIEKNKNELEIHYIGEFFPTYKKIAEEIEDTEKKLFNSRESVREKEVLINNLKQSLVSHHIPAQRINKDLEQFLGRKDIQLKAEDQQDGYQIIRNGEIAKNLSEGEKTALAIVYFLTKLKEEGFDLKESIVVIDDPVCSLDSNAIFQAFAFIKESIKDAGQIFILTHHFDFFRQVKDWFKYLKRGKQKTEHFMTVINKEKKNSSITKIDKLLFDYDSEYQYLFSILYRISKDNQLELEKYYSIPNIARKFLESFLSFKVPIESTSLHRRLEHIESVDSKKKERIRRFTETHSHPRYERGVQDFDMTILGEAKDILSDLLELVETEDKKHYDFLVKSISEN